MDATIDRARIQRVADTLLTELKLEADRDVLTFGVGGTALCWVLAGLFIDSHIKPEAPPEQTFALFNDLSDRLARVLVQCYDELQQDPDWQPLMIQKSSEPVAP